MNRKINSLVVGGLVLMGLSGAYLVLKGYHADLEEQEAAERLGQEILNIDSASVVGMEFTVNGTQVSFEKDGDLWIKADDTTFPVDEGSILAPVSALHPLYAVRVLEEIEDSSEYGMDEPQNTLLLTEADGKITRIVIGATNEGTGDDYVMINDDESVIYTVSSDLRNALSDDLYEYALSEEIPYIQASQVTEISVEKRDGSYQLYREDAQWKAAECVSEGEMNPEYGRVVNVDAQQMNDALASLSGLSYVDFAEHNCEDASVYGLGEDAAVLTVCWQENTEVEAEAADEAETTDSELSTDDAKNNSLTFYIGSQDAAGDYYVQQAGSGEVHTISAEILAAFLDVNADDWEAEETETEETETEETVTEAEKTETEGTAAESI